MPIRRFFGRDETSDIQHARRVGGKRFPGEDGARYADHLGVQRHVGAVNVLLRGTTEWISALPEEVQPTVLASRYPRIANLLFAAWPQPETFVDYIDDLIIDRRGNRRGFSFEISVELCVLRAYYQLVQMGLRVDEVIQ